mmetsp:Transcript_75789/g.214270  ORF Transcript_75789/g.214270 Transcript_75789/m.214270 type:complete len:275 (+) Transcript_75789:90-914(+)
MAAERFRLSVATGEQQTQRFEWADSQCSNAVAARLGSLEWNVVVLDDLTIDLEVSARYRSSAPDGSSGFILLQEMARGTAFRGSFDPMEDSRFAALRSGSDSEGGTKGASLEIEAVVFEFSNAFSWWTGKEVELITLRVRPPGDPISEVPPLPPLQPLAPVAHAGDAPARAAEEAVPRPAAPPELRPPPKCSEEGGAAAGAWDQEVTKYVTQVDAWLAAVEATRPIGMGDAWLEELLSGVAALRGVCKKGPASKEEPAVVGAELPGDAAPISLT